MTAQASIVLEAAYDVLTVPYDCVETDEDGNSVVYVDQDGERTAVSVEVGMQGDYYVEVSGDGLDENTMVYYNTPLVNSEATDSGDDSGAAVTLEAAECPVEAARAAVSRRRPWKKEKRLLT